MKCKALTKSGKKCSRDATDGSTFCHQHRTEKGIPLLPSMKQQKEDPTVTILTYVKDSTLGPKAGKGLFAGRSYKPNEKIIEYKGEHLTKQQYEDRYRYKKPVYIYRRTADDYIDAADKGKSNMARYANTNGDKSNAKFVNDNT
jgi:hypothetical protein